MSESELEIQDLSALDRASGVPFQDEGWRGLFIEALPDLLYVSPEAVFESVSSGPGHLIVNCRYVPREGESDPDAGFHVFTELLALLELRSMSVCQVCGLHGQRYRVNPVVGFALCARHAHEAGFIDLNDTRIEAR